MAGPRYLMDLSRVCYPSNRFPRTLKGLNKNQNVQNLTERNLDGYMIIASPVVADLHIANFPPPLFS